MAMQSQQRTGKIGWDATESQEFVKALKQSLLIMTPLQVVLETLYTRIQSQATMFADLQKRIENIEARDINAEEILARMRTCEETLGDLTAGKLNPFSQQQVLRRLEEVEAQLGVGPPPHDGSADDASSHQPAASSRGPSARPSQAGGTGGGGGGRVAAVIAAEARIETLEARLAGVHNLSGKLLAVELMAQELGLDIPDVEYASAADANTTGNKQPDAPNPTTTSTSSPTAAHRPPHATHLERGVSFAAPALLQPHDSHPTSSSRAMLPHQRLSIRTAAADAGPYHHLHQEGLSPRVPESLASPPSRSQSQSGRMRLAEVMAHLGELQAESESVKSQLGDFHERLMEVKGAAKEGDEKLAQRVAAVEAAGVAMREGMMREVADVRKEVQKSPEVSFADFTALKSRVEGVAVEVAGVGSDVAALRDDLVLPARDQLDDLRDQVGKLSGLRDMDTLFHTRIGKLEGALGEVQAQVTLDVQAALQDTAHLSDLQALEAQVLQRALASDVKQLAGQHATLTKTVAGVAEWLALRPETADGFRGTGSSATRFKCLVCGRDIRTQDGGPGSLESSRAKGVFLPRMEGMPLGPHPHHAPGGPGLNTAELRRMVEDRMNGRKGAAQHRDPANVPLTAEELEAYDQQHLDEGAATSLLGGQQQQQRVGSGRGSPPHSGRSRQGGGSGRRLVPTPTSTIMPKVAPGAHRTPVFV